MGGGREREIGVENLSLQTRHVELGGAGLLNPAPLSWAHPVCCPCGQAATRSRRIRILHMLTA